MYAAHFADLTVQLYAYFGDRQEAQDVVQEAFCRALAKWNTVVAVRRPGRLGPPGRLEPGRQQVAPGPYRAELPAPAAARPTAHVDGPSPERVALVAALATLPATQRRAMVLRYLADLTVAEIADREGVAEGTVKSWLHRGRAALAAHLRPDTRPNRRCAVPELTDDHIEDLFADLRADEIRQVAPAGRRSRPQHRPAPPTVTVGGGRGGRHSPSSAASPSA